MTALNKITTYKYCVLNLKKAKMNGKQTVVYARIIFAGHYKRHESQARLVF